MNGYTKLFGSIVASTIWREAKETKIVWITMLAMANKDGIVEASIPGMADLARVSVDEAKDAIYTLLSPDEYSRTKDHEGRRIEEIDGGWRILNHSKYRAKMNADERREYFRIKKQESRSKSVNKSQRHSKTVKDKSTRSTQSEADTEAVPTTLPGKAVVEAWNSLGEPFPKMVKLTEGRADTLRARIKDQWWLSNFEAGLEKVKSSAWCKGANDRGWVMDFDFFIKPDSLPRIIEGRYDEKNGVAVSKPVQKLRSASEAYK